MITIQELKQHHSATQRRQELLAAFEEELATWKTEVDSLRLWLFGSFLSDKPEPGDIDVLLTGRLVFGPIPGPPKFTRKHPDKVQVLRLIGTEPSSKTALIEKFNAQEGNADRGIQLHEDQTVELSF